MRLVQGMQDCELLALLFIRNAGDGENLSLQAERLMQRLFDLPMLNHFPADLGEAREPIRDGQKSVVIQRDDIAGDVPAIAQGLGRQILTSQVSLHDVGAFDQQHAGSAWRQGCEAVRIDDLHGDARQRLAHGSPSGSRLIVAGGAEVRTIDGDDGGAFGHAVAFDGGDAEAIFEGLREPGRQFLRAGQDHAQGTELLRGAAALIELEKGRRGHEEREAVAAHELADGGDVERGGMKDHARVVVHDQPEDEIAEGVEEGQNPQDSFLLVEVEHLAGPLHIGVDVEVREYHSFGLAGAAAAEDDGRRIVHRQWGLLPAGQFDQPGRGAEGEETRGEFLPWADRACHVF